MTTHRWISHLRQAAAGGALGLAVLAFAPGSASAQDGGGNFYDSFMRGLGLRNGNEAEIDYRERSPLVVPPSRNLPPPESSAAKRNAAWPVDQETKRKKEVAAKRKKDGPRSNDPDYDGRNLTPSELNPPGTGGSGGTGTAASTGGGTGNNSDPGSSLRPSQLGYSGGLFSLRAFGFGAQQQDETANFTNEPPRRSLTEPPVGYQTPSAGQPYGAKKRHEYEKPMRAEDIPVGAQ
jgi:hypothetical protein